MCLSTVDGPDKENIFYSNIGYKFVEWNHWNTAVRLPFYDYWKDIPLNEWMDSEQVEVQATCDERPYLTGFHIYPIKDDAILNKIYNNPIIKVEFSGIICTGTQDGLPVIVAKRMKVLEILTSENGYVFITS